MEKKRLFMPLIIIVLCILLSYQSISFPNDSPQSCKIKTDEGYSETAIFSVYNYTNTQIKNTKNFEETDFKLYCQAYDYSYTTRCDDDNALFYIYKENNTHISNNLNNDNFCWDENTNIDCKYRKDNCQKNEICIFSSYKKDNSHIGDCSEDLEYKLCCKGMDFCGDGVFQEDFEECDYSIDWFCSNPSDAFTDCTCPLDDYGDLTERKCFDYKIQGQLPQEPFDEPYLCGCCAEEYFFCEEIPLHGVDCKCESSVCGNSILDENEECEFNNETGEWGLGCIDISLHGLIGDACTCNHEKNFTFYTDEEGNPNPQFNCTCKEEHFLIEEHEACFKEYPCFGSDELTKAGKIFGHGIFNITYYNINQTNWTHTFNHTPGVCQYTCNLSASYRWNGTECVYDPKLNCYDENDENKCNVILDQYNLVTYLEDNNCTKEFEGELLACCSHEDCKKDLYKYVPIKNVLEIHDKLENCNSCNLVLNEQNFRDFFDDDNCYDRKRNMVCCTSVLCSDEEYKTFVPIWAILNE